MPRKSTVNELQTEEVAVISTVRRSSRIVNGTGTGGNGTPAGVATRRTSQTSESDTLVRPTRGRRASTQTAEEDENVTTRSKRASTLIEEGSQKETPGPVRRGRKPSVTIEPADKVEPEKAKPVRGRRTSRANSEDNEEENPKKTAGVRTRRNSATVEVESGINNTPKIPARASARRRSSATENNVFDEGPTLVKRTTRGRRASDAEEVFEETKTVSTNSRRKSTSQEELTIAVEKKPITKTGRRESTDEIVPNEAPKTPGRPTRRSSINLEPEAIDESNVEVKEIYIKVTPLKKRKIVEKLEAELDLSIINESVDDINCSKPEESLNKPVHSHESQKKSSVEFSENKLDVSGVAIITDVPSESPSTSGSTINPSNRKRISTDVIPSPSNSPRLGGKLSRSNTPQNELTVEIESTSRLSGKLYTPQQDLSVAEFVASPGKTPRLSEKLSRSITPQKDLTVVENKASPRLTTSHKDLSPQAIKPNPKIAKTLPNEQSFLSSGSDGSFRCHLSTVSMAISGESATQGNLQENALNSSRESTGSNKENIEVTNSIKSFEKSVVVPVQQPIIARVSNVFKPNQKECSFMEPMEVDDCSMIAPDISSIDTSLAFQDSSVVFNKKHREFTTEAWQESSTLNKKIPITIEQPNILEDDFKPSCTETEGSDHVLIEETEETVDISVKPEASSARRSKSPLIPEASLIISNPLEKVKVVLSRKSSSPIVVKRRSLRKSRSPVPSGGSTDSEDEGQNRLRVSRPKRISKSKSKTPSPTSGSRLSNIEPARVAVVESRRSGSKSPASLTLSPSKKTHFPRSPSFLCSDFGDSKGRTSRSPLSGNRASRSKSRSPITLMDVSNSTLLGQSSEKPKGSEEVLILNKKIALVTSDSAENVYQTISEETTNNQDKTEYHTAVATTNTDSDFTSIINTDDGDDDVTQSDIKHSESTHYDFDLPSDDDELLESKSGTSDSPMTSMDATAQGTDDSKAQQVESVTGVDPPKSSSVVVLHENEDTKISTTTVNHTQIGEPNVQDNTPSDITKISDTDKEALEDKVLEVLGKEIIAVSTKEGNSETPIVKGGDNINQPLIDNAATKRSESELEANDKESDGLIETKDPETVLVFKDCPKNKKVEAGATIKLFKDDNNISEEIKAVCNNSADVDDINAVDKQVFKDEEKLEVSDEVENILRRKSKEQSPKDEKIELDGTVQDVTTTKMTAKTEKLDTKPTLTTVKSQYSTSIKFGPLDAFATAKLSEYFDSKAKEVEESSTDDEAAEEESEPDKQYNEFIDGMAEEGEEDTPSEDSNQIIDEGESIGSSDSADAGAEEDVDEDDSFICDEEEVELLSGNEYDLDGEEKKKPKKSRIINPNTLEDNDIIIIKKKVEKEEPKRKSRIIKVSDSSSEEETNLDDQESPVNDETSCQHSVIVLEESIDKEHNESSVKTKESRKDESSNVIEDSKEEISNSEFNALNASLQKRHRKSSLSIQENILVDGIKDPMISKRINSLVESFCSTVKKGEVALNLSLEYEDGPESSSAKDGKNTESVHILSNVTICPSTVLDTEQDQNEDNVLADDSEIENELNRSSDQVVDLRQKLNKNALKRRLSKSLNEIDEEMKMAKKRKKNKKPKKAIGEKNRQRNKKEKLGNDLSDVGSFGLINQLITDVKNRPRRVLKPTMSASNPDLESSWIATKVSNLKPSTSAVSRHEKMRVVPKLHPKDFKNQLLADAKRVKRVETKTLLKKKGAVL